MRYGAELGGISDEAYSPSSPPLGQSALGGWTSGNMMLVPVQAPVAGLATAWKVTALSVTGQITLWSYMAIDNGPIFGKLGQVLCGLDTQGPAFPIPNVDVYGVWMRGGSFPRNANLFTSLYDPSSDALPPITPDQPGNIPMNTAPVAGSLVLPQPLIVPAGGAGLYVGVWLLPSMMRFNAARQPAAFLYLTNLIYELDFEIVKTGQGPA